MTEMHNMNELQWRKSSYSGSQGGHCAEVALDRREASSSGAQGGSRVEVAGGDCHIRLRDSRNPALGHVSFGSGERGSFLRSAGRS